MSDLFGGPILIALAALGGAAPAGSPSAPIHIVTEPAGAGVRISVVGDSSRAIEATYSLEVSSETGGGRSRSTQKGTARLKPGAPVTLVTTRLGDLQGGSWTATLHVQPVGGPAYQEVRTSSDKDGPSAG